MRMQAWMLMRMQARMPVQTRMRMRKRRRARMMMPRAILGRVSERARARWTPPPSCKLQLSLPRRLRAQRTNLSSEVAAGFLQRL